jgi:hypothetical protein
MPPKPSANRIPPREGAEDVEAFLASLDHSLKPELLAVRQIILGAETGISEGIKRNNQPGDVRDGDGLFRRSSQCGSSCRMTSRASARRSGA